MVGNVSSLIHMSYRLCWILYSIFSPLTFVHFASSWLRFCFFIHHSTLLVLPYLFLIIRHLPTIFSPSLQATSVFQCSALNSADLVSYHSCYPTPLILAFIYLRSIAPFSIPLFSLFCISSIPCATFANSAGSFENSSREDESNSWIYLHNGDLKRYAQIYVPTAYHQCVPFPPPVPTLCMNLFSIPPSPSFSSPLSPGSRPLTAFWASMLKKPNTLERLRGHQVLCSPPSFTVFKNYYK